MAVIEVEHVSKTYRSRRGNTLANDDVSLHVNAGEVYGLFGHNGAGKTTIVNQMLGLLTPDKGAIRIAGEDIVKQRERGRFLCSIQPQSKTLIGELTPRAVVRIMGELRGADPLQVDKSMDELFEKLDITRWADVMGNKLSGGILRLTGFCMAAVVPGKAMVLDEPTNDVDPVRRRYLWGAIRDIAQTGTAVVLVTHNVREAESIVDELSILDTGRSVLQGRRRAIKSDYAGNRVKLEVTPLSGVAFPESPAWAESTVLQDGLMVMTLDRSDAPEALQWAAGVNSDGKIGEYALTELSLEDLYIDLVGRSE